MTNLITSIKNFTSLNRAPGSTWTEATKRKAPHKPLLLLAVLDLVHRGIIPPPDRDLWPAQKYLAEHRREFRLS